MKIRRLALVAIVSVVLCGEFAGCGGGANLTREAIQSARAVWKRAGIRDYDLIWSCSGIRNARYRVTVRGGEVRRVDAISPDGAEREMHPGDRSAYGVDGLFLMLEEELDQLSAERPFGQPKGSTAVLRLTTDRKLGYPKRYIRDVMGNTKGLEIDIESLVPTASRDSASESSGRADVSQPSEPPRRTESPRSADSPQKASRVVD